MVGGRLLVVRCFRIKQPTTSHKQKVKRIINVIITSNPVNVIPDEEGYKGVVLPPDKIRDLPFVDYVSISGCPELSRRLCENFSDSMMTI